MGGKKNDFEGYWIKKMIFGVPRGPVFILQRMAFLHMIGYFVLLNVKSCLKREEMCIFCEFT